MSEYQYYEWQTLERPLTAAEQKAVNGLSSHIDVTSSQAVVTYEWGYFKHAPINVVAKYFDAHLYNASRLSAWMAENLPEGLMVFSFPGAFRHLLRTTKGVERLHREVRRRARVVSIFPNQPSCLRLVSAILSEISEEWLTGRTYITF